MIVHGAVARIHGADADVTVTRIAEYQGDFRGLLGRHPGTADRRAALDDVFQTDFLGVAARCPDLLPEVCSLLFGFRRSETRLPAVRQPGRTPHGNLGIAAEPQRNGPLRARVDTGTPDPVEFTRECHRLFAPEAAQQDELLRAATPACPEVHAERLVLGIVPADADAQAKPSVTEICDVGRLFGE